MKRPLIPILVSLISGILLEARLGSISFLVTRAFDHQHVPFFLIGGYVCLLILWAIFHAHRRSQLSTFILCLLVMVVGMSRYAFHRYVPLHHIVQLVEDEVVTIEGVLYRPVESTGTTRYGNSVSTEFLYVDVDWLEQGNMRYRVCGKIRITLRGSGLLRSEKKMLTYGDVIRTRLRVHLPKNLSDFDYREYLRRRGIYLLGTLKHDRSIIKLSAWKGNFFLSWMYTMRRQILKFLTSYTSEYDQAAAPTLQVLQAMTLGTSRELSSDIKHAFRNSGLYHILVVSGIHIGIVAGILHYASRLFRIPASYRIFTILPGLVVYAGLSGFQFPVLRAVIMATALYLSITCNRVADSLYSLGFAATILVLIFPDAIFKASFQMTVTATASILGLYQCCIRTRWWGWLQKSPIIIRIPLTTLFVTCGALLGIAPLMLYYFQQLSPYSLVSNIAAFIFITPLLPFTLLLEFLSLIVPWAFVYPVFSINILLGQGLIWVARLFPPFPIIFPQFRPIALWLYYISLFGGMILFLRRKAHRAVSSKKN